MISGQVGLREKASAMSLVNSDLVNHLQIHNGPEKNGLWNSATKD